MKSIYTIMVIAISIIHTNIFSQDSFQCDAHHRMQEVFNEFPGLYEDHLRLLENSRTIKINERGEREEVYIIPIVFHIIHEYGSENISDNQLYDQMQIINEDFRKLNADTNEIVPAFKSIAADAKIEFRLAGKDPFGNCTNGIEHIYSHETNNGDDPSKLNQWPRSRYLNVWVVKSMEGGVAGYAYYPSGVAGGLYYADGIIIRHNYIGSIGTSSVFNSRALTHEIGHYLGLPHTWGNTNNPGVACGNDGIADTPETAGYTACTLSNADNCNNGIEENIQNYMEYAYCSRMFTVNQVAVMHTVLEDGISSRDNLWTESNLEITGTNEPPNLCAPIADFHFDEALICAGQSVSFENASWNGAVDNFEWHFPGGVPEYSSDPTPVVNYPNAGYFNVSLTVFNSAGSNTKIIEKAITVQGDWWEYNGPFAESFSQNDFPPHWIVWSSDETKFEVNDIAGFSDQNSVSVVYYKSPLDPILDLNYWERIGGSKEELITPTFNLENTSGATLSFKYAFAVASGGQFDPEGLSLKVYYSKNCGDSWVLIENIQEMELVTAGFEGGYFIPTKADWRSAQINLPNAALETKVRFRFEFTAIDFSNNFYLDDINVNGVLLNEENSIEISSISVYPNPIERSGNLSIKLNLFTSQEIVVEIYDLAGNLIESFITQGIEGDNTIEMPLQSNYSSGIYQVNITSESSSKSVKLVIQ